MHSDNLHLWQHSHTFGQDLKRPGNCAHSSLHRG